MSEWTSIALEDLADDITVGFVGSMTQEYVESGIPFLRSKNVEPYRINLDDLCYVSSEFHQKIKKSALSPGDVVIVRTGKPGAAAIIPESFPVANCSDLVIVRPSPKLDRNFLIYYLNSIAVRHINSRLVGAVQQHFNIGAARELKIHCPPIEEQQEIASVLTSLDRKIENLRKQNETLEAIAQTLFKHWFVDFEFPKGDGKPYRSSGGEMVRSESGEIPAGWSIGTSGDLIYLQGGFAFKSQDFKDFGNHRILKIKNISGNVVDIQQTDFIADSTAKRVDSKFKVKSGDVLIAMTGAEVAKMGLVPTTNEAIWLNQRVGLFREVIPGARVFIYCLFTRESHQQLLRDRGSGSSAQPNISGNDIESIPLVKPIQSVLAIFAEVVEPLIRKKCDNLQQIQTLTKTRDVLLPKLMSGKLRITAS